MDILYLLSTWYFWLTLAVICLIAEIFTVGFFLACFSVGAILAIVPALLGLSPVISMLVFALFSFLSIFFIRPLVLRNTTKAKIGMDALIGREVRVKEAIDNLSESGRVLVDGDNWRAKAVDDSLKIEEGALVEIVSYESIVLIVKPIKK